MEESAKEKQVLQWHPAFYAGIQIEFEEEADKLIFENEHQLGTKPKQIDVLIIKKDSAETIKKNIGRIFRKYNIMEYKSPSDYLSIDDFYKVYGYACFFKSDTVICDSIKAGEISISFVCRNYPRKLAEHLRNECHMDIIQNEQGIYYVVGAVFTIQIIVTAQVSREDNFWLRNLSNDLNKEDEVDEILQRYEPHEKNELYSSVMDIIVRANYEKFNRRGDNNMCEALREIAMAQAMEIAMERANEIAMERANEIAMERANEIAKEKIEAEKRIILHDGMLKGIRSLIEACKSLGATWEVVLGIVEEKFTLANEDAVRYMELYW